MIKGAIFDQDGLLFDTESVYQRAWIEAGRRQGVIIDPAVPRRFSGMGRKLIKEIIAAEYPLLDWEEYSKTAIELAWNEQLSSIPPKKPGLIEMLSFCRENGIKTAVASSSRIHIVRHNLTSSGVIDYFDAITTGEEVVNSKPAPDIFLLAASKIGIEPKDCAVFEDAFSGIRGAHAAGMKPILIPDQAEPTGEIRQIAAVYPTLDAAIEELRK
ncbi:MAG: HAD family phosphatase [Kiritimatiellae bacterium]|nr:HAD family phosphatase [Kiritimatiellia bacterium]